MYKPFNAVTSDFSKPSMDVFKHVSPLHGPTMCLRYSRDEIVCITKEQAMEFFGLVDPGDDPKWDI